MIRKFREFAGLPVKTAHINLRMFKDVDILRKMLTWILSLKINCKYFYLTLTLIVVTERNVNLITN